MSNMQAFYDKIHSDPPTDDDYVQGLVQLSRADVDQVAAIDVELSWEEWWVETD